MWAGGQVLMLRAYNYWGVGLTMPVTTALQLVLNAVLGIILFSEWRAPGAMPLGVTSLIFIMVGAAACFWQERSRFMRLREQAYERGLFFQWEPEVPYISVGNISWGGTGKTPVCGWVLDWARLLPTVTTAELRP